MIIRIYNKLCHKLLNLSHKSYFTNTYGLGRSLLAFGTLLTLIFNSKYSLIYKPFFEKAKFYNDDYHINLFLYFDYDKLYIPWIISIIILIIVIYGIFPRVTGILHWWVSYSFINAITIVEGGDQITANLTFFLIPITLLDNRKNHWNTQNNYKNNSYANLFAYFWFLIITIQMSILYLQAGIEKPYKVEEWLNGTAIYYWLNNNIFGLNNILRKIFLPVLNYRIILFIINWGVIILELILAGAIFMNDKRKIILFKFAIILHFMIALCFGLISFFFAMLGGLVLYLLPKENNINFKKLYNEKYSLRKSKI